MTKRGGACRESLNTEEISRVLPASRQLQSVAAANGWASGRVIGTGRVGRPAMPAQAVASSATPTSTLVEAARPAPSRRRSMGSPPPPFSGTPPNGLSRCGVVTRRATFATLPPRTLDAAAVAAANTIARVGAGDALLSGRRKPNRSAAAATAAAATDASGSHDPAAITTNIKVKGLYTLGWRSLGSAPAPAPNALAS